MEKATRPSMTSAKSTCKFLKIVVSLEVMSPFPGLIPIVCSFYDVRKDADEGLSSCLSILIYFVSYY